jgi:hypothetical protein
MTSRLSARLRDWWRGYNERDVISLLWKIHKQGGTNGIPYTRADMNAIHNREPRVMAAIDKAPESVDVSAANAWLRADE